ncbi:MAG TPA: helix-turn-helix domain-containing protein [Candidatus Limnocylindria bacterium]|nr:helix-turn-helix domain-containing protein [Candidatus Limnocylindria bacterium]
MTELDDVLRALADPTRRDLLRIVIRQPGQSTAQLVGRTDGMTRWGVMKHLAVLRDAGLIQTMAEGRHRRHFPEKGALRSLRQWLDEVAPG